MRLPYILMATVSTLSVHQVPVTASVGSDAALTGVMSLGFLHLVGADQSVSDQSRFLRGSNIAEGSKEERGFADIAQQAMAKNLVDKIVRTKSFSSLEKVDDLATFDKKLVSSLEKVDVQANYKKLSAAADDYVASMFKVADDVKMKPSDLATHLKDIPGVDDAFLNKVVGMYTKYLNGVL